MEVFLIQYNGLYVVFGSAKSTQQNVAVGVPQGSILEPLLFLIYINDLSRTSSYLSFVLFADDTNVFASDKSKGDLYSMVNSEMGKF